MSKASLRLRRTSRHIVSLAAAATLAAVSANANADELHTIPPPSGGFSASANAISGDGTTVVGSYIDSSNFIGSFYWRGGGSAIDIGNLGARSSGTIASALSMDGGVVVGTTANQAFRWTQADGFLAIPLLAGGVYSSGLAVSGDGSIVVGQSTINGNTTGGNAFYWSSATGSVDMGTLDVSHNAGATSKATAISAGGGVIVGQSTSDTYTDRGEAFRWQAGTMIGLGTLTGPGPGAYSQANAVNANGSVIVGQSSSATVVDPIFGGSGEAFRWTQSGGMVGLGALNSSDTASSALGVSADGSVVVGSSTANNFQNHAFRWTQPTGMMSVQTLLTTAGVNLTGWNLDIATGISADGTIIVGSGVDSNGDSQAWIARFSPTMGTGITTPINVAESFAGLSALTQSGNGRLDSELGTQSEIANDHACPACAFAYGTGGSVPGDPFGAGALGIKLDVAPDTAIGVSLGAQAGRTSLVYDGSLNTRGGIASLFVAYLPETGPQLIGAATGERVAADITRGYLNGNSQASSTGNTDGYGYGGLLRAGWTFKPSTAWRLTPFASYSATRAHFDGWTETTGVFPATFDAIDQTAQVMRLGTSARYSFTPQTWMWGQVNWAHHFDATASDITGHLIGLFTMTVPGNAIDTDYVETTLGVRVPLNKNAAISVSGSTMVSANTPASFLGRVIVNQSF